MDESVADVTGSAEEAKLEFDKFLRTDPDKAARQILKAVQRNRRRALIGPDAVVFDAVSRLPAGIYQRVLAGGARRQRG
nr:hypothetical protein [Candidatus Microthrix sp.]